MTTDSPFDILADEYDAVRAGYVPELIEDVLAFADLGEHEPVLEVGCGPGTATRLFAPRVARLTAVEPSARFVEIVRSNMVAHAHVDIVHGRFEEWDGPASQYGLLFGARSFQWMPPDTRFTKPARHLRRGGTLALFWHWPVIEPACLLTEIQDASDEFWPPRSSGTGLRGAEERIATWQKRFRSTEAFTEPELRCYPWSRTYDVATFIRLMNTWPLHRHLNESDRKGLEERVRAIFERRGSTAVGAYQTALFLARRR